MSKVAKFNVSCFATYPAEIELPDKFFKESGELIADARDIIDYLEGTLDIVNAGELEWVADCENDPIYSADIHVDNNLKYTAYVNGDITVYNKDPLTGKTVTETKENDTFTITCYGETETYPESKREEMKKFYLDGMLECDGSERERYANIYVGLCYGKKEISDEN